MKTVLITLIVLLATSAYAGNSFEVRGGGGDYTSAGALVLFEVNQGLSAGLSVDYLFDVKSAADKYHSRVNGRTLALAVAEYSLALDDDLTPFVSVGVGVLDSEFAYDTRVGFRRTLFGNVEGVISYRMLDVKDSSPSHSALLGLRVPF